MADAQTDRKPEIIGNGSVYHYAIWSEKIKAWEVWRRSEVVAFGQNEDEATQLVQMLERTAEHFAAKHHIDTHPVQDGRGAAGQFWKLMQLIYEIQVVPGDGHPDEWEVTILGTPNSSCDTYTVRNASGFIEALSEQAEKLAGPIPGVTRDDQDRLFKDLATKTSQSDQLLRELGDATARVESTAATAIAHLRNGVTDTADQAANWLEKAVKDLAAAQSHIAESEAEGGDGNG